MPLPPPPPAHVLPAGSATATGNTSTTQHDQSLTVAPGSDPTIAQLAGAEANAGGAAANTGANSGEGVTIQPGSATALGNQATAALGQRGVASGTGGGLTLLGQRGVIASAGGALADTGFNADGDGITTGDAWAWGSSSGSVLDQAAAVEDTGGLLRTVQQGALVGNVGGGLAETGWNVGDTIETGRASAGGSAATTGVEQGAATAGVPAGPPVVGQTARSVSAGGGVANTGGNSAAGDASTNVPE